MSEEPHACESCMSRPATVAEEVIGYSEDLQRIAKVRVRMVCMVCVSRDVIADLQRALREERHGTA